MCGACLFSKGGRFEGNTENNLLILVFEKLFPPVSVFVGETLYLEHNVTLILKLVSWMFRGNILLLVDCLFAAIVAMLTSVLLDVKLTLH